MALMSPQTQYGTTCSTDQGVLRLVLAGRPLAALAFAAVPAPRIRSRSSSASSAGVGGEVSRRCSSILSTAKNSVCWIHELLTCKGCLLRLVFSCEFSGGVKAPANHKSLK